MLSFSLAPPQIAQSVKNPPAMQETPIGFLGREDPLEKKRLPAPRSGLENSKDCIVHGIAKSQTSLSDFHFHFTVLLRFLELGELGVRRPAGILSSVLILFHIKASSLPSRLRDHSRQSTALLSLAFLPQIPIYPSIATHPPRHSYNSVQFSSVAQSCPTLCNPMDCSTPGLPVHHQLLEFTQTHVH